MNEPKFVQIGLLTSSLMNNFLIQNKAVQLEYKSNDDTLKIEQVKPLKWSIEGNIQATLIGDFSLAVKHGVELLTLGSVDLTQVITLISESKILFNLPPTQTSGQRDIILQVNRITYQNLDVVFSYTILPQISGCHPPLGPSSSETMLTIRGQGFWDTNTNDGSL